MWSHWSRYQDSRMKVVGAFHSKVFNRFLTVDCSATKSDQFIELVCEYQYLLVVTTKCWQRPWWAPTTEGQHRSLGVWFIGLLYFGWMDVSFYSTPGIQLVRLATHFSSIPARVVATLHKVHPSRGVVCIRLLLWINPLVSISSNALFFVRKWWKLPPARGGYV